MAKERTRQERSRDKLMSQNSLFAKNIHHFVTYSYEFIFKDYAIF